MKFIGIMTLLLTLQAQAGESIDCKNSHDSQLSYQLRQVDDLHYQLTVKKVTLDPHSCRSRWGCDWIEEGVYQDTLEHTDVQGTSVFESKRAYIVIEDMENVQYSYVDKDTSGNFVWKSATLVCN